MLKYLVPLVFTVTSVYVTWNIIIKNSINHKVIVNSIMLLSLNICTAALWSPVKIEFIIICCLMKLVVLNIIITEYHRLTKNKVRILVNGKTVSNSYILKPGDVVESNDFLNFNRR